MGTVDVPISTVDVCQNIMLLFGWQLVEHVHDGLRRDRDGLRRTRPSSGVRDRAAGCASRTELLRRRRRGGLPTAGDCNGGSCRERCFLRLSKTHRVHTPATAKAMQSRIFGAPLRICSYGHASYGHASRMLDA